MAALGAFTFVLHSHLPYARLAGTWPHGEEWIHEAASETYIPLLNTLYDLKEEGIKFKLTVGITPILAEQLADALVLEHFDTYLDLRIEAAKKDMIYFEAVDETAEVSEDDELNDPEVTETLDEDDINAAVMAAALDRDEPERIIESAADIEAEVKDPNASLIAGAERFAEPEVPVDTADPHLRYMAEWYKKWYENIKQSFDQRYNRDIIGAFRQLQEEGYIEITTCAATHGYLPLLGRDSSIRGQLKAGISSYTRMFGHPPTG
ncbi:MAG: hypothetical protein H7175_05160, partial [Burkholderiales bacterium]|nr:hypothetical protein [Anaerolineae bacterium]